MPRRGGWLPSQRPGRKWRQPERWNSGYACVKADAALFQVTHDAAGRVQSKGAAAGEQDGVDAIYHVDGVQQVGLARGRRASTHIDAARGRRITQDHGAARACLKVGVVTDTNAGNVGYVVMHIVCCLSGWVSVALSHMEKMV